jgi:hypothetical protein
LAGQAFENLQESSGARSAQAKEALDQGYRVPRCGLAISFNFFNAVLPQSSMLTEKQLQVIGPLGLVGAIVCAQLCAHALAEWPTSSLVWYLNLEVFRPIRYGIDFGALEQWLGGSGLTQSIWITAPLLGLVAAGLLLKNKLPLALASHISLLYSALILYESCDTAAGRPTVVATAASFCEPSSLLATSILLASIASAMISHQVYWREIFSRGHTPRNYSTPYTGNFGRSRIVTTSRTRPRHSPSFSMSV